MADVKDIMGVTKTREPPKKPKRRKAKEVTSDLPPLAPVRSFGLKKKRQLITDTRPKAWVWAPFTNDARDDGLILYHWQNVSLADSIESGTTTTTTTTTTNGQNQQPRRREGRQTRNQVKQEPGEEAEQQEQQQEQQQEMDMCEGKGKQEVVDEMDVEDTPTCSTTTTTTEEQSTGVDGEQQQQQQQPSPSSSEPQTTPTATAETTTTTTTTTNTTKDEPKPEYKLAEIVYPPLLVLPGTTAPPPPSYRIGKSQFATFDKKLDIISYTDMEYMELLQDPEWTKEQTDLLFDLAELFDCRFIVVADRFRQQFPTKTIDDLRDRYYTVTRLITKSRSDHPRSLNNLHIFKNVYDKQYEIDRRKQAEALYARDGQEVWEELYLINEYKRIDLEQKKQSQDKKRSRKPSDICDISAKRRKKKQAAATPPTKRKEKGAGAYSRGSKMVYPLSVSAKTQKHLELALDELGIPARLMPTSEICESYNGLRRELVKLFEMQSLVKKKELELTTLRTKHQTLTG